MLPPTTAPAVIDKMRQQVKLYRQHKYFKEQQQKYYKESIELTTPTSCVVVVDFKENFKVGGGPVETSRNFFERTQISVLGFAIYYRNEDGEIQLHYKD